MKDSKSNINKFSALFFQVGLIVATLLVTLAFEWKFYDSAAAVDTTSIHTDIEELLDIPVTNQPPPPPQKIQQPIVIEIPNEEEIEEEIEIDLDVAVDVEEVIEEIQAVEEEVEIEEEETDEVFTIVEQMASYHGGPETMIQDIANKLKYPENARRRAVEGRVFVAFIVEKSGVLTNIRVVKGIGAGCDEEAVRIIKTLPSWNPAKQRGRPVRSSVTIPLTFRLN